MVFSGLKKETPPGVMYNTTGQMDSNISPKLFSLRAQEKTGGNRTHFVRRPSESCAVSYTHLTLPTNREV